MRYEFLRNFQHRMKTVGSFVRLLENCARKEAWKQCGFDSLAVQVTMLFAVLLFIMEQSSRGEACTLDDIAGFIGGIGPEHFGADLAPAARFGLAKFIVQDVLTNGGRRMRFPARNFETGEDESVGIDFISGRMLGGRKRSVSYSLTENGYALLFGTLEMESNLRISVNQMIFEETLKKSDYGRALDSIKEIVHLMRREKRSNEEAAAGIRGDVASFSMEEHAARLDRSLEAVRKAREKLRPYQDYVADLLRKFEDGVEWPGTDGKRRDQLEKLKAIQRHLHGALGMELDVVLSHNAYRDACDREFLNFWRNAFEDRISFEAEIFGKVLGDASLLERADEFLHPLFSRGLGKTFVLADALESCRAGEARDPVPARVADADVSAWKEDMRRKKEEHDARLRGALREILSAARAGGTTLKRLRDEAAADKARLARLASTAGIFSGLLLELVRGQCFSLAERPAQEGCEESAGIADLLQSIAQSCPEHAGLAALRVEPCPEDGEVLFEGLDDGTGTATALVCTNLAFTAQYSGNSENSGKGGDDA